MYIYFCKNRCGGRKGQLVTFEPTLHPLTWSTRFSRSQPENSSGYIEIYIYIRTGKPTRHTAQSGSTCLQPGTRLPTARVLWTCGAAFHSDYCTRSRGHLTHGSHPEEGSVYASTRIDRLAHLQHTAKRRHASAHPSG